MSEMKDTNPFAPKDSVTAPPPLTFQQNPFPINPTVGNPWASSQNNNSSYQQYNNNNSYNYGHGHNNSSTDSGSQSNYSSYVMPMPNPDDYKANNSYNNSYSNNNTYNTNAYGHSSNASHTDNSENVKDEYDNNNNDNTTELDNSMITANPGIEASDPNKLNISSQMVQPSSAAPNIWRLLTRFIQFIASIGAFVLIVAASPATKQPLPEDAVNKVAVIFLYIVSFVSIVYSFSHLIFYCLRRWGDKNKAPRWSLILIDVVLGASFGTLMVFLIKDSKCKPGDYGGWCHFYNSAIFFTVLSFVTYAVSFLWDIVGGVKR